MYTRCSAFGRYNFLGSRKGKISAANQTETKDYGFIFAFIAGHCPGNNSKKKRANRAFDMAHFSHDISSQAFGPIRAGFPFPFLQTVSTSGPATTGLSAVGTLESNLAGDWNRIRAESSAR